MKKVIVWFLCLLPLGVIAQTNLITRVDSSQWSTEYPVKWLLNDEREVLYVEKGFAVLNNIYTANGSVEVEIKPGSNGCLAGLLFRLDEKTEAAEYVYRNADHSGTPDVVAYCPSFHQELNWQLYPQYQVKRSSPSNDWMHLKIVYSGEQALVFINREEQPSVKIDLLRSGVKEGKIGLWVQGGAYFSNLKYRENRNAEQSNLIKENVVSSVVSYVTSYELSSVFVVENKNIPNLKVVDTIQWSPVLTDSLGVLDVYKYRKKSSKAGGDYCDAVWLRITVNCNKKTLKTFAFDFASQYWIYLNDKLLYSEENTNTEIDYLLKSNKLELRLKKGENIIYLQINAQAHGWGGVSSVE